MIFGVRIDEVRRHILKYLRDIFSFLKGVFKKLCFSFQFSAPETDMFPAIFRAIGFTVYYEATAF